MTEKETMQIMAVLEVAYPRFYKDIDKKLAFILWHRTLQNIDYMVVDYALTEVIKTCKFPPTVADIYEKIDEIKRIDQKTPAEYWVEIQRAVQAGQYRAEESFEKLSAPVKKFVGGASGLIELCMSEQGVFTTVTRGQFLKQIVTIVDREDMQAKVPDNIKALLTQVHNNLRLEKQ